MALNTLVVRQTHRVAFHAVFAHKVARARSGDTALAATPLCIALLGCSPRGPDTLWRRTDGPGRLVALTTAGRCTRIRLARVVARAIGCLAPQGARAILAGFGCSIHIPRARPRRTRVLVVHMQTHIILTVIRRAGVVVKAIGQGGTTFTGSAAQPIRAIRRSAFRGLNTGAAIGLFGHANTAAAIMPRYALSVRRTSSPAARLVFADKIPWTRPGLPPRTAATDAITNFGLTQRIAQARGFFADGSVDSRGVQASRRSARVHMAYLSFVTVLHAATQLAQPL